MSDRAEMKSSFMQKMKASRGSFANRLFLSFAGIALGFSLIFLLTDFIRERQTMKQTIVNKGRLLSAILAYHVRTGLFAENPDMLKTAVEAVTRSRDVVGVRVFDVKDRLLYEYRTKDLAAEVFTGLPGSREIDAGLENERAVSLMHAKHLLFAAPVMLDRVSYADDLFFDTGDKVARPDVIGYVHLAIDWKYHEGKIRGNIVIDSLIALLFFFIGSLMIYWYSRRATRPLATLAVDVRSYSEGKPFRGVPVKSNDEVGRLADAFYDMTALLESKESERQRLETQFRQAQKMEAVGTMAGGIAHDFKNILTAISGFSSLAKMSLEKDDPAREYVEHILTSSSRASALVQSLLAFSRQQVISPKAVDLNTLVANVEKMLMRLIREDICLVITHSHERLMVMADSGQIDQILMNLSTNARDAMPDGGTLSIATGSVQLAEDFFQNFAVTKSGMYAMISVSDTGIGMDRETLKKIFDPFFTTKEVGRGSGLGLASVYGIVKQHGGYIDVKSEIGQGTAFNIYLPMIYSDDRKEQDLSAAELKRGSETILVAEDDEEVRIYIHDILRLFGYTVIEAADGDEAVRIFSQRPGIDLLLLDVVMPEKNGREVLDIIRILSPKIRALFISGHPADIISKRGVLDEGINFIAKPVSPEELLSKIREILDSETQ